jgi:opacity protein-like surface antigen
MGSLRVLAIAGAAAVMTIPPARAADHPPIIQRPPPAAVEADFASGWYLRGDIGVGVQNFESFDFTQTNAAFVWPASWRIENKEHQDPDVHRARHRLPAQQLAAFRRYW